MSDCLFVYHPDYLEHKPLPGHPESPERLRAIYECINQSPVREKIRWAEPQPIAGEWLEKIHGKEYIRNVSGAFEKGERLLDGGDTQISHHSYRTALLAAGGVVLAIDEVMNQRVLRTFCAVRPPGHHARPDTAMGFCLFNNIAIGTRYAQVQYGISRVLIIDWDVHHGNGTQEIFYEDPTVFYFSTHQYPFYPGTGGWNETGRGPGDGTTRNVPMPAGCGDAEYLRAFDEYLTPAAERFQPELILISAGFDAHEDDPLANMKVSVEGFRLLSEKVRTLADQYCGGRLVSVLEGGYHLKALARSVETHLNVLAER